MSLVLQVITATALIAMFISFGMFVSHRVIRQRLACNHEYKKTGCQGGCGGRHGADRRNPAESN